MESQSRLYYQCAEEPVGRGPATGNTLTVEPNVKLVVRTNVQICVQLSCERGAITRHKHSGPFMRKMSSDMTLLVLSNGTQSLEKEIKRNVCRDPIDRVRCTSEAMCSPHLALSLYEVI